MTNQIDAISSVLTGQYCPALRKPKKWLFAKHGAYAKKETEMPDNDDDKKSRILDAAATLFGSLPFHKVLLSDVASAARVGKGTLYLYFKNKDELYLSVLFREFAELVDRMRLHLEAEAPANIQMQRIVEEITYHLFNRSCSVELMRGSLVHFPKSGEWQAKKMELCNLIEQVIVSGIEQGIFEDKNPKFTSLYIPGLLRSVSLSRDEGTTTEEIVQHACSFILNGLRPRS